MFVHSLWFLRITSSLTNSFRYGEFQFLHLKNNIKKPNQSQKQQWQGGEERYFIVYSFWNVKNVGLWSNLALCTALSRYFINACWYILIKGERQREENGTQVCTFRMRNRKGKQIKYFLDTFELTGFLNYISTKTKTPLILHSFSFQSVLRFSFHQENDSILWELIQPT